MKNRFLILVALLLLGSTAYAQVTTEPDWNQYPGAKTILDNMEQTALSGADEADVIKKNLNIYSKENCNELVAISGLRFLPIAICKDYLSKAGRIQKAIDSLPYSSYTSYSIPLGYSIQRAERSLERRPIEALLSRIVKRNPEAYKRMICPAKDIPRGLEENFYYVNEDQYIWDFTAVHTVIEDIALMSPDKIDISQYIEDFMGTSFYDNADGIFALWDKGKLNYGLSWSPSETKNGNEFIRAWRLYILASTFTDEVISKYNPEKLKQITEHLVKGIASENVMLLTEDD